METPKVINLGSGKDFRQDCINIDKEVRWEPDIIHDLNEKILFDGWKKFHTKRFGEINLERGEFKKIIAHDVLEHIQNLTTCMKSCLELLEDRGTMEIIVPYDLSLGAWQDPNHVRAFNQNSWKYYNEWAWYLGLGREIFEVDKLVYNISNLGKDIIEEEKTVEEIISTPRAIDSMSVILKKKMLG